MRVLFLSLIVLFSFSACKTTPPVVEAPVLTLDTEEKKVAYSVGVSMAETLKAQGLDILDMDIVTEAMQDVYQDKELKISANDATPMIKKYVKKKDDERKLKNKVDGEKFIAENKTKEGVIETESGLQYKIITKGEGELPKANDRARLRYTGKLIDGSVFDTTEKDEFEPIVHPVNGFIKGFTETLLLMPIGSKYVAYIPAELAYGERGAGSAIPPNSTIIFEIELLGVE